MKKRCVVCLLFCLAGLLATCKEKKPVRVERLMDAKDAKALWDGLQTMNLKARFVPITDFLAPGAVSDVLSPEKGWMLWQTLYQRLNLNKIQPIVINNQLYESILARVKKHAKKWTKSIIRDRNKVKHLKAQDFFDDQENERKKEQKKNSATPWSSIEKHRTDLQQVDKIDLLVPGTIIPFHFLTSRAALLKTLRSNDRFGDKTDDELAPQKEYQVRVLVLATSVKEVPVLLRYGDCSRCPKPHQHALVWDWWRTTYHASLVFLGADTVEFFVSAPPTDPQQVRQIAWQQYLYCEDIVDRGVGSLRELAKTINGSTRWFFWWD